jgi:hypothetical protein
MRTSKQVTVICDSGHSNSSSNLDVTKSMMRSTVVECKCNNEETIMRTSKQVTVICDSGHSNSSSNLDVTKSMMRSTVVQNDTTSENIGKTGKRGYQHVYKSRKKSSITTQEAYKKAIENGKPKSVYAKKRNYLKKKRLDSLMQVSSSHEHSLGKALLQNSCKPLFYSGAEMENSTRLRKRIGDAHMLFAINDLKVIDTMSGARLTLPSGDNVFTLIPRPYVVEKLTRVNQTIEALHALEDAESKAEVRGIKRVPVAEDNGKYTTVGLKPNRGSTGIIESWPKRLSDWSKTQIRDLMKRCHEVAKGFIPGNDLRGLRSAQWFADWPSMVGMPSEPIWGSLACGKNYCLNSHTDEDFFYSLTTIVSQHGLQPGRFDKYRLDAEVTNYFAFAEQGVAVALRPGDMLLFNPLYQHCLTSRTLQYQEKDVFCVSLYLKTAVVGGNNNTK